MGYDPRWNDIAADWLRDLGLSEPKIRLLASKLSQKLHDTAEDFMADIAAAERERWEAAYDAHIDSKIDEARGK